MSWIIFQTRVEALLKRVFITAVVPKLRFLICLVFRKVVFDNISVHLSRFGWELINQR